MSDSNTILPTAQINGLEQGLDKELKALEAALGSQIYFENLPIIGTQLGKAFNQGQAALTKIGVLEADVKQALTNLNNLPNVTLGNLQTAINGAVSSAGFANTVLTTLAGGSLTLQFNNSASTTINEALGSNFGVPGLNFATSGSAATTVGYNLDIIGTVDASGNFAVSTPLMAGGVSAPALSLTLGVKAPTFTASASLGSSDATLGFLKFNATDKGSNLNGTFAIDTNGGAKFNGSANLDVALGSNMGSAALPSVSAELVGSYSWSGNDNTVGLNNQASFGDAPSISLKNVTYDFGTFVNKFIEPILNEIAPILQPIEKALAVFDTPLNFLGGGTVDGGNDGLLGTNWHLLDVAGAVDGSGNDTHDGQITLVDLLKLATGANLAPMVNFLTTVTDIVQWATALSGSNVGSALTYDLGSFTIPNDIRAAGFDISQIITPAITGGQDLSTFLAGLSAPPAPGATPTAAQALQELLNPSASSLLSFPIISNPLSALQFLLGGTADLFDANFLVTPVSFGAIDPATGNPTQLVNVVPPINLSPIPLVNFDLTLQAALQATVGLNFGYDTSGLTAFKNSNFADPSKILNGLFVEDPIQNGVTEPVAQISGAVQLGVEASAILASIGGGGNIGGTMSLSFSQPGKNYLNVLANKISNQGALSIFDASGRVTAGFQAVVKALGSTLWTYNSPRITLATFDTGSGKASSGIPNATTWVGPVGGDFETSANWNPTFANIKQTDYYGDATIGQSTTANFAGQLPADLASLSLGTGSVVNLAKGKFTIDGTSIDSINNGTIAVNGAADLVVSGSVKNVGAITVGFATGPGGVLAPVITADGLMQLYGGGHVILSDATTNHWMGTGTNPLLWNLDNTISGAGTIDLPMLNQGVMNANGTKLLVLTGGAITNQGLLEATGNGKGVGAARTGGLSILSTVQNGGGTIAAHSNGSVIFQNGITINGGMLQTSSTPDGSIITTAGLATLDGGTSGLTIAGNVTAGTGSTLTLTGLINSAPYSTTLGQSAVSSVKGTVLLQGATIKDGELNAITAGGSIKVTGTATLDGSDGAGSLALDGLVHVSSGNTLVVAGSVNPGKDGGGIELTAGTLLIGNATTDAANFAPSLAGSVAGTGGSLLLDDVAGNVVTGADAGSSLTNSWTIRGSGQLGNGQLAILNATKGVIEATGANALVLNGGGPVINAGLIEAGQIAGTGGMLDLQSSVANAGGTIAADTGTTELDGAATALTIGGGVLATSNGGAITAIGNVVLDGTASKVTIATAAAVTAGGGATLTLKGAVTNNGFLSSVVGGTLDLQGTLANANGVISTVLGAARLDGVTLSGGSLLNAPGDHFEVVADSVLDGSVSAVTLVPGALVVVDAGHALTLKGSIVDHGTISLTGNSGAASTATLKMAGLVALSGGGTISLADASGSSNAELITGAAAGATLDNVHVAISGYGKVGAGNTTMTLKNESGGVVNATSGGGSLILNTGANAIINLGLLEASAGGVLDVHSNVTNALGTIAGNSGIVELDVVTVSGGVITTTAGGTVDVAGSATLNGVAAAVTIAAGGQLSVGGKDTLTLKGTIVDAGVLSVTGTSSASANAELLVSGTVALTGGGVVSLQDVNGSSSTQIVIGTASTDLLDNVKDTISGFGRLGAGLMTLKNETAGTINATFGTLAVYTGANSIANTGLLEATNGVLDLRSNVNNSVNNVGGTIGALVGGITELDQITVAGGSFTSTGGGSVAVLTTATLDGTTNAITLQSSAQLGVGGSDTLTLKGSIVDQGQLSITANGASAAKVVISGAVALSGTGTVVLENGSAGPVAFTSESITSAPTGGTLDHLGGTIFGYGEIIGAKLALINEKGATVEAAVGNLLISTGTAVSNLGLLEAVGGDLLLRSPVTNGGTILAGAAGVVSVQTTVTNTGLVSALNSGIVLVQGNITGPTGTITIASGGMIELDQGTLDGGTLNNAAKGTVAVTESDGTLANISVVNAGVISLVGNSGQNGVLHIAGSVQLTGGGLVSLSDNSGFALASSQVITGTVAGDTLDNVDNTITGYGQLGNGLMTLENETSGTIDAIGGTLVVNTGTNAVVNTGLLEAATSSVLDLRSDITNTGGTIDANGGAVDLDKMTVVGGTLTTENGGTIHVTGSAALAGVAGPVTLTLASHLEVDNGQTLTVEGSIVNQGTLSLVGNGAGFIDNIPNSTAFLDVSGTATLSGGGTLSLFDGSGNGLAATEVVTGTVAADTLDNFDNTISGYGQLGDGLMTLKNEASATINAVSGTLTVDTGINSITNKGLLEATTGVLQLNSNVANVGGIISAQSNLVDLDAITVAGGVLQTSGGNSIQVIGASALDGTNAVTLASGAQLVIGGGDRLTLGGSIINHGTMSLAGNGAAVIDNLPNGVATMRVGGLVTLSGGGLVSLSDVSGNGLTASQVITGTVASDTLENVDNTISGNGQLGNGLMILENDAGGTINANGGTLVINTGKNTVVNEHLIEVTSGVLDLRSNVSNAGATIAAVAAPVQLDGMTVIGGTLTSSAGGSFQVTGAATLDGTNAAVTLALGTQLADASGDTLTLKGGVVNHGTVAIDGNGAGIINKLPNSVATLRVGGVATLSGGGLVSLSDVSGNGLAASQVITGTVAGDTLDNFDNTISGFGLLGNGLMTLKNEAKGTIEATGGGILTVDTGKNSIVNIGLLEGVGGALQVKSTVTNSGTNSTGTCCSFDLNAAVANTGLVSAAGGGTITLRAALSGATSATKIAAASTLVLDGGVLQGGTVSNAATGSINVTTNGGALNSITVVNAGLLELMGNGAGIINKLPNSVATLHVGGVVTLSGGGTVSLLDVSGNGQTAAQVITGTVAGDTLDNIDNTISGFGQLGNGLMTLKNEAKGTIDATGATLTVDTGKNSIVNKHLIEATSGLLDLRSNVSNVGGTIAAIAAPVQLDGMTVSGGTLSSSAGGSLQVIGAATLDGTAAVTLALGTQLVVASGDTLTLKGSIANHGTVAIDGNGAGILNKLPNSVATLRVGGVVTLSGGGTVSLLDVSGNGQAASQVVTGTVAGDTLDNIDNTISGFGQLGNGLMTLKNESKGTIEATGGTLTVDTSKNSIVNIGLLEGVSGALQVKSAVTNSGTIATASGGSVDLNAAVANTGVVSAAGGGTITLRAALSGATSTTKIAAASTLILDGGVLQGGTVSNAATGSIKVTTNGGALQTISVANAGILQLMGNGAGILNKLPNSVATLHVGGVVTLSGGGTVSLLDVSGNGQTASQVITGTVSGDTLDNIDNTISGFGVLGNGLMTLKNEAKGTIEATGGILTVDTGKNSIVNVGLLEGVSGALQVKSAVTNSGMITTGSGGSVDLNAAVANTGVVSAAGGGTITLRAALSGGATNITNVAAASTLVLDGGVLQGGTVSNAATGNINVTTNGGALQTIAVANAGLLQVMGNGAGILNKLPNSVATLHVGGVVTLSGGGTVSLLDVSGNGQTASQVITGTVAGDTLDNIDNTISGFGLLGNGLMTLKNETKGTINASGGVLVVDTGTNSVVNKHLIEATSGLLDLRSNIANAGATIAAVAAPVQLDGMTVMGGTLTSSAGGSFQAIGTATLDGTTSAVTLATATQLTVASGDTLVLNGSITNQGTVAIDGNGAGILNNVPNSVATLRVGGVVTLSGGGTVSLLDVSGNGVAASQVITGTIAGDTLDNIDNTISGFGLLGNGLMTLKNEAKGTINATGGTLTVDTGSNSIVNKHLIEATSGVLDLRSNVTNASGTIAGSGATVELDGMTVSGGLLSNSAGGAIQVIGTATLDGTATAVTLTSGTQLVIGNGNTLILKGSVTDQGSITDAGSLINNNSLSGSITISGSGQFSNLAGAKVTGAVSATAAGETIANLGTVTGAVTLAGSDLLITGAGAVFTGGIKDNGGNNALEIAKGPYTLTKFDAAGTAQFTSLQIDAGVKVTTDATDIFTGVAVDNLGTLNAVAFKITNSLLNSGVINGDVGLASGATLNNLAGGTISGSGLAAIAGTAGPATVLNAGLIDPGTFGINLAGGGSVTNLAGGVIEGATAGVKISGGAGIVTNAGTISGGGVDSVVFASGFTNRVVVDTGAKFIGVVDGGNKAGSGADSTLEFAVGAGGTKLSGLGTAFINFATLSVDSGALMSLQDSNTIATIGNAGTLDAASGTETLTAALITAPSGSNGVLEIDASGDLVVNAGNVDATQSVMFTDGTGTLTIGTLSGFAATIGSAATGDEIIVQGTSIASTSFNAASHVLSLLNASKGVIGTLTLAPSVLGSGFKADGTGGITLVDAAAPAAPSVPDLLAASGQRRFSDRQHHQCDSTGLLRNGRGEFEGHVVRWNDCGRNRQSEHHGRMVHHVDHAGARRA